jgi:hypothetical protein
MLNAAMHEFVTEVLDESSCAFVVALLVGFLRGRGVETVTAEYGFVVDRDVRGDTTAENCTVPLDELEALIQQGMRDGTIEWGGSSDFRFKAAGLPVEFVLCNDGDIHFSSSDSGVLREVGERLSKNGINVYGSE